MPESLFEWNIRHKRLLFSLIPYLGLLEKPLMLQRAPKKLQPCVFILGLPRSGTTLIYQYIVHRLRMAYFTNLAGHYYLSPCLVTYLQQRSLDRYYSDFKSQYGKVRGPLAPREAGAFWGRFFGFEDYLRYQDISLEDVQTLQDSISCIQQLFGNVPFVNKNVKHMLRIDLLNNIFPDPVFLLVDRKLPQIALSMIRARYSELEDPKQWWSVKPPNYTELKHLSIGEQIANQLISLKKKMIADLSMLPPRRVMRIQYENFCQNPEEIINQLKEILGKTTYRNAPVTNFEPSIKLPQTDEEYLLINLVKQYEDI